MAKSKVLPDTDSLEDLDFQPQCVVRDIVSFALDPIQCERVATWAANCPGCGDLTLVCDEHRKGDGAHWLCPKCGRRTRDLLGWRRL